MKKLSLLLSGLVISADLSASAIDVEINNSIRSVHYIRQGVYAVAEGDIILMDLQKSSAVIIPPAGGTRWEQGMIPFTIATDLPIPNKIAVYQAIQEWEAHSNVKFVERTEKNTEQFPDYIFFTPASGTVCSSWVGRRSGPQAINLAPRCKTSHTIHEIGHALGLWHEQSRADRDEYVKIILENIEEEHQHNFDQHLNDGRDFGVYDYGSMMHYSAYAFSKNGEKTILALQEGGERMGQREHLSEKDIAAVNAMYPKF